MVRVYIKRVFIVLEVQSVVDVVIFEVLGDVRVIGDFVNNYVNIPYLLDYYVKLIYSVLLGDTVYVRMYVSLYLIYYVLRYLKVSDVTIITLVYVQ